MKADQYSADNMTVVWPMHRLAISVHRTNQKSDGAALGDAAERMGVT